MKHAMVVGGGFAELNQAGKPARRLIFGVALITLKARTRVWSLAKSFSNFYERRHQS